MDSDSAHPHGGSHKRSGADPAHADCGWRAPADATRSGRGGKTRLALAAATRLADHFRDGVVVVDLSTIRDHQSVLPTIAQALGLTDTGQPPLAERLRDFLRERSLLLTLDNLEQVLPAAAAPVANLVASCPDSQCW